MTQKEWSSLLSEATKAAKDLNDKSDLVQRAIDEFEAKLKELSFGIECWLEDWPLSSEPFVTRDDDDRPDEKQKMEVQLGYGRYADHWALLLRDATYCDAGYCVAGDMAWDLQDGDNVRPLNSAPRMLRIEALKRFPSLLEKLIAAAKEATKVIEEARTSLK